MLELIVVFDSITYRQHTKDMEKLNDESGLFYIVRNGNQIQKRKFDCRGNYLMILT